MRPIILSLISCAIFLCTTKTVHSSDILFFNQDCNVDAAGADNTCADERYNLLNLVNTPDNNITLLPDFHQADMANLLVAHDFLLIPDLEDAFVKCDITDPTFISPAERMILRDYIENGGSVLVAGSAQNIDFLNMILGLSLMNGGFSNTGYSVKNEDQSAGTPFEDCPDEIPNLSATFMVISSLPDSKICMYSSGGNASVAYFKMGEGSVTYLGYDFFDAGPECTQEASIWSNCALNSAVEVATYGPQGFLLVPTLSEWGIIILFLILSIIGVVSLINIMTVVKSVASNF